MTFTSTMSVCGLGTTALPQCDMFIPSRFFRAPGTLRVTAWSPPPGGGTGPAVLLSVVAGNPSPYLTNLEPHVFRFHDPATTITLTGSGFTSNSVVTESVTLTNLSITRVSFNQIQATLPANLLSGAWQWLHVYVTNPRPGGGRTQPQDIYVF